MLRSGNLDNQTYNEIMEHVFSRLPWISPDWTDYNPHDPGITILELMAWYKEMQQFHMNVVTTEMKLELLKLLGVSPEPPKAAQCFVDIPHGSMARQKRSKLFTSGSIPFELAEAAHESPQLKAVFAGLDGQETDLTGIIGQPSISVSPFTHLGEGTMLTIGLADTSPKPVKIWFEVDDRYPVSRNEFKDERQCPRVIEWSFSGCGVVEPASDETHALSRSGYVIFDVPKAWEKTALGDEKLKCISLRLLDSGCEETVRLCDIRFGRFAAVQQETWSDVMELLVPKEDTHKITLKDKLFADGIIYVFLRKEEGLVQGSFKDIDKTPDGRTITLNTQDSVQDGSPNLLIAGIDSMYIEELVFDSTGLPDMSLMLPLRGRSILKIGLICDDEKKGKIQTQSVWEYSDNLITAKRGEHVFGIDMKNELLKFGDGERGGIVMGEKNTILLAPFVLSYCSEGNVPDGVMYFEEDGLKVANTAAVSGAAPQTVEDACTQFLHKLNNPRKCVSESDYEREALRTPGLRVAAAKAIAGYDPDEPTGRSAIPCVTVVAVPYSGQERAIPDRRFLNTITRHLDSIRTICTKVKVIAPRYMPIEIRVSIRSSKIGVSEQVKSAVADYLRLSPVRSIGSAVIRNDLLALISKIEGVYKIERLELSQLDTGLYLNPGGDIIAPRDAIVRLKDIHVDVR